MTIFHRTGALLSMLVLVLGPPQPVPAQAMAPPPSEKQKSVPGEGCVDVILLHRSPQRPSARAVPVVFVHGINTNAHDALWPNPDPKYPGRPWLRAAVEGIPAAKPSLPFLLDTYAFDYHANSLNWVTDVALGPRLARGLMCLARAYGVRPIVVAHSMGGLIARFAAAQSDGVNGVVGDHLAEVITIATPYQGSLLLTLAQGYLDLVPPGAAKTALEAVISWCIYQRTIELSNAPSVQDGPCSLLAIRNTAAGKALKRNSEELAVLPAWPGNLRVHGIAGNVKLSRPPIGVWRFGYAEVGDIAVSVESAIAGAHQDVPFTVTCDETVHVTTIEPVDSIRAALDSACFHLRLVHHPETVNDVVNEVILAATASAGGEHLFIVECVTVNPCSELFLVRTDSTGANPRVIGGKIDDAIVAVSPDGNEVALVKNSAGRRRLYVRSVTTGQDRLLTTSACGEGYLPSWSPDGRTIAFLNLGSDACKGGVYTVPAAGGTPSRALPASENPPSWDPISDRWAVTTIFDPPTFPEAPVLYVSGTSGANKTIIYRSAKGIGFNAIWSPDGSTIGVTDENRVIGMTPDGKQLWTSSPTNLISQYPFAWARNGLSILYGRSQPKVYRADPITGSIIAEITTGSVVVFIAVSQ